MKLSIQKGGAVLAVLLLGVGLARHATSSSTDSDSAVSALADAPLLSLEAESSDEQIASLMSPAPTSLAMATPQRLESISAQTSISAETLAALPFSDSTDIQIQEQVLDRPPATPAKPGQETDQSQQAHQPMEGQTAAALDQQPQPETAPDNDLAAESAEPPKPPEITEEEARNKVLGMFGGESSYRSSESDMAHAYAAAKKALRSQGITLSKVKMLAVIDFTLPSFDRRLAIYNPRTGEESRHLVAHGHHSGELYLESYSNVPGSLQSSPGLYRIGRHYNGEHGRAIRLHGLQKDINNLAYKRDVVLHAAWYVSYKTILENQLELGVPRIGRSHGCPAVSAEDLPEVLGKLQPGAYLFIYPVPAYVPSPRPEAPVPTVPSTDGLLR